jgi:hypothetical protein
MTTRRVLWVGATTVGLVVGGFALHFPGSFAGQAEWSVSAGVFGFVLGSVNGLAVGLLQRLVLGRRAGAGVIAWMALAIGGTHAVFDASSALSSIVLVAALAGVVMAAAYLVAIRDRSLARVATVGVAWAVALLVSHLASNAVGLPLEATPFGWAIDHAFDGVVLGLGWSIAAVAAGVVERLSGSDRREAAAEVIAEPA